MQLSDRTTSRNTKRRRWATGSTVGACAAALLIATLPTGGAQGAPGSRPAGLRADAVYINGTIITMGESTKTAQAVAVRDGKIVGVGSTRDIVGLAGNGTKTVNLRGNTMLPGFIDAHSHFASVGTAKLFQADLQSPPVGPVEDIDDLVAALKLKVDSTPSGEWVRGRGYDQTLLAEQRHPTTQDLDRASVDHPIWAGHANGHMGVANSAALELAGIDKDTPNPPGGVIVKDPATGEPTGLLEETAQSLVTSLIPPYTAEQKAEAAKAGVALYTAAGVTTSVIAGGNASSFRDLQEWRSDGLLPIRFTQMHSGNLPTFAQQGGMLPGFGNEWIKIGPYGESVYDGSIQGYTGYLQEPYHKLPPELPADYRGYPTYSKAELFKRVRELYEQGHHIAIHANGDQAIEDLLDAYEAAQDEFGKRDVRWRIEHAQMTTADQLVRMKDLGVSPSFFVSHTYYWGDVHRDIFMGPERAARISPLASATKLGIRYSVHLDSPVVPMSPLQAVWSATTRLTRSGKVLGPDERVSARQALKAVTIDAAWQNFEEDIKGSIEVGKLADFVVVKDNPLTVEPVAIKDIEVLETIVDGEPVYTKAG